MLDLRQFDDDDDWEYTPKEISDENFNKDMDYLKSHPLFMKELPKNLEGNKDIQALQNLIYDEEPIKIAKHLNEKGKEILQKGQHKYYYREAIKTYDDALIQDFEDNDLKSKILSNRAMVNYKLKNYGNTIKDSLEAIKLNPSFIKPYFRCGQAYLTLDKYEECIKISEKGLSVDPECKEIKDIKAEAEKKLALLKEKEAKKGQESNQNLAKLDEVFKQRGYVLGTKRIHDIPSSYQVDPFVDSDGKLKFPVIVTYLEFSQIDFIQQASEEDLLSDHLKEIFKENLPWDEKGFYEYKDLIVFVELNCVEPRFKSPHHTNYDRTFFRVGKRATFSDILKLNGFVLPFVLELYVLSKASPFFPKFLKEFDITRNK